MAISIEHGGARHPIASIDKPTWQADDFNAGLKMDGRAVLDFMQTEIPTCVKNCLNKNQLNESDVDQFIFHQASKYMLELLIRRMGLPRSKVPIEVHDVGNTVSSSIPIALERQLNKGVLGKNILVCGFGVGLSWAANVIKRNS